MNRITVECGFSAQEFADMLLHAKNEDVPCAFSLRFSDEKKDAVLPSVPEPRAFDPVQITDLITAEKRLIAFLMEGKTDRFQSSLPAFFQDLSRCNHPRLQEALTLSFLVFLADHDNQASKWVARITAELPLIQSAETLIPWAEKIADAITASLSDSSNPRLIESYIKKHVFEESFCASKAAEFFSMSVSSFSRFFKKSFSHSFTDYICALRILEAKKLLQTTSLPLEEVAHRVGYANSLSLSRAFKKMEGKTPGYYRKAKKT